MIQAKRFMLASIKSLKASCALPSETLMRSMIRGKRVAYFSNQFLMSILIESNQSLNQRFYVLLIS